MAGEGGEREERRAGADPVDVVQDEEEAGFLCVGGWVREKERAETERRTSTLVNRMMRLR